MEEKLSGSFTVPPDLLAADANYMHDAYVNPARTDDRFSCSAYTHRPVLDSPLERGCICML